MKQQWLKFIKNEELFLVIVLFFMTFRTGRKNKGFWVVLQALQCVFVILMSTQSEPQEGKFWSLLKISEPSRSQCCTKYFSHRCVQGTRTDSVQVLCFSTLPHIQKTSLSSRDRWGVVGSVKMFSDQCCNFERCLILKTKTCSDMSLKKGKESSGKWTNLQTQHLWCLNRFELNG